MKILCISDETERLIYSNNAKERYKDIDFVLSAGDLNLEYNDYILTVLNKELYYVFGNHNLKFFNRIMNINVTTFDHEVQELSKVPYSGILLDGKAKKDKKTKLLLAGVGGSMRYNKGLNQYTDGQMRRRLKKLVPRLLLNKLLYGRYLDILVAHSPPLGIGDGEDLCHTGFKCFLKFMEKYQPKYLIHGHIHLYDENANRVNEYCNTKIINVFRSYIIEDSELGVK